jgi:hypothetical protein
VKYITSNESTGSDHGAVCVDITSNTHESTCIADLCHHGIEHGNFVRTRMSDKGNLNLNSQSAARTRPAINAKTGDKLLF